MLINCIYIPIGDIMDKSLIVKLQKTFEDCVKEIEGVEFWYARDLQSILGYVEWRKFLGVIDKAKDSCQVSGNNIDDHFVGAAKMIALAKGAAREIEDLLLTRYACYLIAQNGDPRKEEIAFAQSYFAIQTRKQELVEKRIALQERFTARNKLTASETELSKIIYERGVDDAGFARIRSKGDEALFGGFNTLQMKSKLGVPNARPLADFLPTVTITAKNLATEITNFNVKKDELDGEPTITKEHFKNNSNVRELLTKSGIKPEELPAEEDIKKLERKVKKDERIIASSSSKHKRLKF
jgi:DNA-damage-inducible protein D